MSSPQQPQPPHNLPNLQNHNHQQGGNSTYLHLNSNGEYIQSFNHPPLPGDPIGIYSTLISDEDLTQSKKKFLKVSGQSEVEFEPDRIDFCIEISSTKEDMISARESVKKRQDYILAALRKNSVHLSQINVNELVTRTIKSPNDFDDGCGGGDMLSHPNKSPGGININNNVLFNGFKLVKEIHISTDSICKYLHIYSVCNEKLDTNVAISSPVIKFSPSNIQKQTQKCIRHAVLNAVSKANELIKSQRSPNMYLGPLVYTVEDSLNIQNQDEYSNSDFELFKLKKHNKRITIKITSVYEITYRSSGSTRQH